MSLIGTGIPIGNQSRFVSLRDRNIEADTMMYNAAIRACDKRGDWQHALQLFCEMLDHSVEQDAVAYNVAISACRSGGRWQHALELYREMSDLEKDVLAYSTVVGSLDEGFASRQASHILVELAEMTGLRSLWDAM
mmetsp:Transcript_49830/g.161144  ORF Transcript_49830/g.161144 Transcript_49830/m.161144 type:complete len:136 (-) Transcript_49830:148-555(-)